MAACVENSSQPDLLFQMKPRYQNYCSIIGIPSKSTKHWLHSFRSHRVPLEGRAVVMRTSRELALGMEQPKSHSLALHGVTGSLGQGKKVQVMFQVAWGHPESLLSKRQRRDLCFHQDVRGYAFGFNICVFTDFRQISMQMTLERLVPLGRALSHLSWLLFLLDGGWFDVGGPLDGQGKVTFLLLSLLGVPLL